MNKIEINGAKETMYYEKLDNGLEVYMLPNLKVKNFYITYNVKFGSIHTNFKYDGINYEIPKGVAHYLEHLMFNMPDGSAFDYFSSLGSNINAFTSFDVTCYEVFANTKFKENLSYLIHYVNTPYFTKELVNNERGIITEEIKMYEDNPSTEILYGLYRNIYVKDEHKNLISGTEKDVKKITKEDVDIAYKAFYHPENMFVIITGNFNPEEALAIIIEEESKTEYSKYIKPIISDINEPFKVTSELNTKEMNVDKPKATIGFKIPKKSFKSLKLTDVEVLLYLNLLINVNFGPTSLLNEELESNGIITDEITYSLCETDEYLTEAIIGSTNYPDYFIKRVKEVFNNMTITEDDIRRKIKATISNFILLFDNIEAVNGEIQDDVIRYNTCLTDIYKIYKTLNTEDAQKFNSKLNKYLISINILNPKE